MRFPKEAEIFNSSKAHQGNLIESYASILISDFDITFEDLQVFMIE
jgi:hypothetical protein